MSRRRLVFAFGCVLVVIVAAKTVDTRYPWLWAYIADQLRPEVAQAQAGPTHVLFTFVDHFEPRDQAAMDRWMSAYPDMARRHRDADGSFPQHTWFWYFKSSDDAETLSYLQQLARLAYEGFGEVELHSHPQQQTESSFLEHMAHRLALSRLTGALVTAEPTPRAAFGFIHGLWSLDNSRGGQICGLNNELVLLARLGCYADFTHPSWGRMHPRIVNRLYYATDDPARPKSYDTGTVMREGGRAVGDLLIFEGPSVVRWNGLKPTYDHGDVTMEDLPTPERVDAWVQTGIHVQGRPEWVFVKVFTHGAIEADHEAVLGDWRHRMHTYLEARYNDGTDYVLHYVTAREAYNIAKAAEAGRRGNPNDYRNFVIPPPVNRVLTASAPFDIQSVDAERVVARFLVPPGTRVEARLRARGVTVTGDAADVVTESAPDDTTVALLVVGEGVVVFGLQPRALASQEQPHE
jgi:hypothetical protein